SQARARRLHPSSENLAVGPRVSQAGRNAGFAAPLSLAGPGLPYTGHCEAYSGAGGVVRNRPHGGSFRRLSGWTARGGTTARELSARKAEPLRAGEQSTERPRHLGLESVPSFRLSVFARGGSRGRQSLAGISGTIDRAARTGVQFRALYRAPRLTEQRSR